MILSQTTLVKSSTIESVYYSNETHDLMVTFKNNSSYTYQGVTYEDYLKLITSDSIGKSLNQVIKGKYEYKKHEDLF